MKKIIFTILLLAVAIGFFYLLKLDHTPEDQEIGNITSANMEISSTQFTNNGKFPVKYTCDGQDINPPLAFSGTPEEMQSLVLIVDDPDAPSGTWVHWTVFNIDPKTTEIKENSVPQKAIEGLTSYDTQGYKGPCPPSGTHRYFFKIYALDTILELDKTAKFSDIEQKMEGHILDQAEIIGLYTRD